MATRKDYIAFAALLASETAMARHNEDTATLRVLRNLTLSIADIFAHDSTKFDRQKFYRACMKGEKHNEQPK